MTVTVNPTPPLSNALPVIEPAVEAVTEAAHGPCRES